LPDSGATDDADRVREQVVVVVGTQHDEMAALEPLERGGAEHDFVDQPVFRLGGPRADKRFERPE
jgi:hypothetical protein